MTVEQMHYQFKLEYNKIDSEQHKNLLVPEIDYYLNLGQNLFIKMIAEPRFKNQFGFETSKRSTNDIKNIVVNDDKLKNPVTITDNVMELPENYLYFLKGKVRAENERCGTKIVKMVLQQHDDTFENRPFYKSSFLWGKVNILFSEKGIEFYPKDFECKEAYISYIRKPKYIHYAEGFGSNGYNIGDIGLTGKQNCELFPDTHNEIISLAVLLAASDSENPNYKLKIDKLRLFNLN